MQVQDIFPRSYVSTRYYGSKRLTAEWIFSHIDNIDYDRCLDACGGTGIISFEFKRRFKEVHYNDILKSNYLTGKALIENKSMILSNEDIEYIIQRHSDINYPNTIKLFFKDMFFTQEENQWLDIAITNINSLKNEYKRALAFFCLFQSSLVKRPYNLFHRKNLYLRTAHVKRTFKNKLLWDTPFQILFKKFAYEANAVIFDNGRRNRSHNKDILQLKNDHYDLIYLDPPYICNDGRGSDYYEFYGFLEGMSNYKDWKEKMQLKTKIISYLHNRDWWLYKNTINNAFEKVFKIFKDSTIVISYRSPGTPSLQELDSMLSKYQKKTRIYKKDRQFALSRDKNIMEILLIGSN